jgi:hypothetical protein
MSQNENKENLTLNKPKNENQPTNESNKKENSTNYSSQTLPNTNETPKSKLDKNSENSENLKNSKKQNFIFVNIYVDFISYMLISAVVYNSYFLFKELPNHVGKIRALKPEYPFPTAWDMLPTLYIFIFLVVAHKIFLYFTVDKLEKFLSKRYDSQEIQIYKHKVSTNIIKFALYLTSTVIGYLALKDLDFFPWTLGGSGEFKKVFAAGYPGYLFFEKPQLFDFYYNFNLAFSLFDTYILLTYPMQSDFLLMVLHHLVTFNLVVFSFLVNTSSVGSIVYFVHYSGDVLSMFVRICIHLNIQKIVICYLTIAFLFVFAYTRLFVLTDVMYHTFSFQLWEDNTIFSVYLCCFISVLMMLNIIWILLITKKVVKFILTGKVEEIYKIKKNQDQDSKKDL